MKNFLFIALMMSCLYSCSQSHEIAGDYEKKSRTSIVLLKLYPSGTFQFDSYTKGLQAGTPAEPSISGRGTWSVENSVIYFATNPETDIDYRSTLNFNDTKAKFINASNEKVIEKLEFFESGIFWINGMELKKRN